MFQRETEEAKLTATTGLYRRLCCTQQRMQLVVMGAVLALVRAGHDCRFGCHPSNFSIRIHGCDKDKFVNSTICSGHCFQRDPVYISDDSTKQKICNGDWTFKVEQIKGCQVSVIYPVARKCVCTECKRLITSCERFNGDIPHCKGHLLNLPSILQ